MDDAIAWYGANSDPTIHNIGSDITPLFLLTSPQLEMLGTASEVQDVAAKLLAIVNGVLFLRARPRTIDLRRGPGTRGKWKMDSSPHGHRSRYWALTRPCSWNSHRWWTAILATHSSTTGFALVGRGENR